MEFKQHTKSKGHRRKRRKLTKKRYVVYKKSHDDWKAAKSEKVWDKSTRNTSREIQEVKKL